MFGNVVQHGLSCLMYDMKINLARVTQFSHKNCFAQKLGEGGTPYNGLYGEAPPKRGTFFRFQVYKRVGISQVEVYKRVGESVI